jgi:hypothetical protein
MSAIQYQKRESIDDIVNAERDARPLTRQAVDDARHNAERGLAQAEAHLLTIQHNPIACRNQENIIAGFKRQLAGMHGGEWLK